MNNDEWHKRLVFILIVLAISTIYAILKEFNLMRSRFLITSLLVCSVLTGCSTEQIKHLKLTGSTESSIPATESNSGTTYEVGSSGEWSRGNINIEGTVFHVPCEMSDITSSGYLCHGQDTSIEPMQGKTLVFDKDGKTISCYFYNLSDSIVDCGQCAIQRIIINTRSKSVVDVNGLTIGSSDSELSSTIGDSWKTTVKDDIASFQFKTSVYDYGLEVLSKKGIISQFTVYCSKSQLADFAAEKFGTIIE